MATILTKDMVLFIDEIKEFIEKYTIEINGVKYIALSDIEKALDIPPQKIKEPKRNENSEPTNY